MSVLSNSQIRQYIADDRIVCHPFNPDHVAQASLDLTLGYYFYRIEATTDRTVYNPFDPEDTERYFDGPYRAMPHAEWCSLNGYKPFGSIPADHPIIVVKPGERLVAHTHEFVGIRPPGACQIRARSSWARNGLQVCLDAGWVDPGYINRLTLSLYNTNHSESLVLPVGERIAQLIFYETGQVDGDYGTGQGSANSGKYQSSADLETLIRTWSPGLMLPQAHKDERTLPVKIDGMSYD